MPTGKRGAVCRGCRQVFPSKAHLSKNRLCDECGIARLRQANRAMVEREGPEYERWRESMRRAADA